MQPHQLLNIAAVKGQLAHLLLFHGGSSLERTNKGLELACRLNCNELLDNGEPCENCPSCKKIATGNHPDVEIMGPAKLSMGIEQILDWQERVYRKHYEGKFKVFILEEADKLTIPAANALLKVIEEPPERTIIILSTQNGEALLPTIQSRAQGIYFPVVGEKEWFGFLPSEVEPLEAKEAFRLSGGNPELAQAILELGVEKTKDWLAVFYQAIEEKDFLKIFSLMPVEKKEVEIYLQIMVSDMRKGNKKTYPRQVLAVGKALERVQMQGNPRLVIEGLALELFR